MNETFKRDKLYNLEQENEYFTYLDTLRESGVTNMFGARPYIEEEFGVTKQVATSILSNWMKTFEARDRAAREGHSEPEEQCEGCKDDKPKHTDICPIYRQVGDCDCGAEND